MKTATPQIICVGSIVGDAVGSQPTQGGSIPTPPLRMASAITPDRSGERALEGGPIERSTVRREHMLDRPLEQRAQPLGDLLGGHAVR